MRRAVLFSAFLLASACAHDPLPARSYKKPLRMPSGSEVHCTRAVPAPLLDKKRPAVLSASFRRLSPGEALERGRLAGNILLLIRHEGCAKTAQTFTFKLLKENRPDSDRAYWYGRAADLLRSLGGESLKRLSAKLKAAAASTPAFDSRLYLDDYQYVALTLRREGAAVLLDVRYEMLL